MGRAWREKPFAKLQTDVGEQRVMIMFRLKLGLFLIGYSFPALADGPFGVTMGSDIETYDCEKGRRPGFYSCNSVPKPHADFESYIVRYTPSTGICWVKAIGLDIQSNSFGSGIRSAVDRVAEQISVSYGDAEKRDFLMDGSIWDEADDWMMSMHKDERFYSYIWDERKFPNDVKSVYLSATVQNRDSGYIVVEFSFMNEPQCEEKIKKEASDSF